MLNRAIGGAYGYGTHIGGYWDLGSDLQPTRGNAAALGGLGRPVAHLPPARRPRGHRACPVDLRTPHRTSSPTASLACTSVRSPILALWKEADETGVPITPAVPRYPSDPGAAAADQEWLLGPDVLVAPVVQEGVASRAVYFPAGCWRSPESGQEVLGPVSSAVGATIGEVPFSAVARGLHSAGPVRADSAADPHPRRPRSLSSR